MSTSTVRADLSRLRRLLVGNQRAPEILMRTYVMTSDQADLQRADDHLTTTMATLEPAIARRSTRPVVSPPTMILDGGHVAMVVPADLGLAPVACWCGASDHQMGV